MNNQSNKTKIRKFCKLKPILETNKQDSLNLILNYNFNFLTTPPGYKTQAYIEIPYFRRKNGKKLSPYRNHYVNDVALQLEKIQDSICIWLSTKTQYLKFDSRFRF